MACDSLLDKSVQKRLGADVPVGALLSGGLDSSLIVALMARYTNQLNTFTVSFEDDLYEERTWARKIAKKFGTNHHELILTEQDAFSFFEKMVHHQDEPLGDAVCIPLYFISKQAHDAGVKVLLAGEGSDELFCGYPMYVDYVSMYRYWQLSQHFLPFAAKRGLIMRHVLFMQIILIAKILLNHGRKDVLFFGEEYGYFQSYGKMKCTCEQRCKSP